LRGNDAALAITDVNTLSSEKPRVKGPDAGSKHRQRCTYDRKHYASSQIVSSRKGRPYFNDYDQHSRHRCKKTDKKKDAAYGREGLPYDSMPLGCHQHFGDSIMGQDNSGP